MKNQIAQEQSSIKVDPMLAAWRKNRINQLKDDLLDLIDRRDSIIDAVKAGFDPMMLKIQEEISYINGADDAPND